MSWIDAHRTSGRLDGRCLCGAVRIVVDGSHVAAVSVCHCGMCQRSTGYAYGSFVADAEAVTVEGAVATYASTPFSSRSFCPTCGSHLWLRDNEAGEYELFPGLFPAAAEFPLVSEIYTDRRPAYVPLAGDHRTKTQAEYEADNPHVEGDA
ncbi:GFA family protein [Roseobacter sp. HKCCA0434]|uniref:GFA family protein n=1 Tax=Roseobacter sp. HKCCA0434 TaxID=3079297 RepID=UPI0029059BA7|nr:GFA family protein [Roseobacter sp. HKCCA0434]